MDCSASKEWSRRLSLSDYQQPNPVAEGVELCAG
jgi:hypothetical protein